MGMPALIDRLLLRSPASEGEPGSGSGAAPEAGTAAPPEPPISGPAEIFAAIRDGRPLEAVGDGPADDGETYALLSRLDEIWQEAPREA